MSVQSARLIGSRGEIEAKVGDRFMLVHPRDGTWEIVEFDLGDRIYSPSGLGGAPTVWCRFVAGGFPPTWREYQREDGCVAMCGDSVASALLSPASGVEGGGQ